MKVVLYLMDGHFHATRHVDACGVLHRAAAAAAGEVRPGRGDRPEIWDDAQYPKRGGPQPHDHTCVAKAREDAASLLLMEAEA